MRLHSRSPEEQRDHELLEIAKKFPSAHVSQFCLGCIYRVAAQGILMARMLREEGHNGSHEECGECVAVAALEDAARHPLQEGFDPQFVMDQIPLGPNGQ